MSNATQTYPTKLHLACGTAYLQGWCNIDLDAHAADLHCDLRNPLPFLSNSVDYIFCEHFFEHIDKADGVRFLHECKRVLKPKGRLRISTPNLHYMVQMYLENKIDAWANVQWLPATRCDMINEGMRSWGHIYLYDQEELALAFAAAGFDTLQWQSWHQSTDVNLQNLEYRPFHQELIAEAVKVL